MAQQSHFYLSFLTMVHPKGGRWNFLETWVPPNATALLLKLIGVRFFSLMAPDFVPSDWKKERSAGPSRCSPGTTKLKLTPQALARIHDPVSKSNSHDNLKSVVM